MALRRGHITDNPLARLDKSERPRIHKRPQRVLTHQEIRALLEHAPAAYKTFLTTAVYTGMRLSELLGLTWTDIDTRAGVIRLRYQLSRARIDDPARRVRLKTDAAARDIPLLPQLATLLAEHKLASQHSADEDYVFATTTGTPINYRNAERRGLRAAATGGRTQPTRPTTPPHPRPPPHLRKPPHHRPQTRHPPRQSHPRTHQTKHHPRHLHPPLQPRPTHSKHPYRHATQPIRSAARRRLGDFMRPPVGSTHRRSTL